MDGKTQCRRVDHRNLLPETISATVAEERGDYAHEGDSREPGPPEKGPREITPPVNSGGVVGDTNPPLPYAPGLKSGFPRRDLRRFPSERMSTIVLPFSAQELDISEE